MTDTDPYLVSVVTHRPVVGRYGYAARAGQASPRAVLRRLGHTVSIAIAIIVAGYFIGQLLRLVFPVPHLHELVASIRL